MKTSTDRKGHMTKEVDELPSVVRKLRKEKDYSQKYVAEKIGISVRTYLTKEANPDKFTVAEIKKLSKVLEVKEAIFFANKLTYNVN